MSYKFASNIAGTNGPINFFPIYFEHETIKEWINDVRSESNIIALIDWVLYYSISPSNLRLFVHIENDDYEWDFEIKLKNVREYKKYLEMGIEEMEKAVIIWRRDIKIDEILED